MQIIFTLCSNNYLAYAGILGNSIREFQPNTAFYIILVDELIPEINYQEIGFKVIPIRQIEPEVDQLAGRYNIVELNTCVKPRVFEYLFEQTGINKVAYLDPDTKLFAPMQEVEAGLDAFDIIITPHIESPIPLDRQSPGENHFLNYGIYNLGFIALSKTEVTANFITWWKQRTYHYGYDRVGDGLFVDQLYINLVPLFFSGVDILKNRGYNMGPWNLHERWLSFNAGHFLVNGEEPLVFFHFSSFKIDSGELPVHYYSRYRMADRPDLKAIYEQYNLELHQNDYKKYSIIPCYYAGVYFGAQLKLKESRREKLPLIKKLIISAVHIMPYRVRRRISNMLLN